MSYKPSDKITVERLYVIKTNKDCKGPDYRVGKSYTIKSVENTKVKLEESNFPLFTWQIRKVQL